MIKQYHNKCLTFSIDNECIYYGNRVEIPDKLKVNIFKLLHDTHVGVCRMKTLARAYVWWLRIDKDIELFAKAKQCEACQVTQSSPSKVALSK